MLFFLRTTIIGGVAFLIPVVAILVIVGKSLQVIALGARPVAEHLGIDGWLGVVTIDLLSVLLLLVLCFLAGIAARSAAAQRLVLALERNVLERIPAYTLLKSRAHSLITSDQAQTLQAVLVRFDDTWQLAFQVDELATGHVVIHLPSAPDVWTGSVCIVERDRVVSLNLSVKEAADLVRQLGIGSATRLGNVLNKTAG